MSPIATSEIPIALTSRTGMSSTADDGNEGTGKPWGRMPITSTPCAGRSSTTDSTIETTTATRMPGVLGDTRLRPRMMARLRVPTASAHGFVIPRFWTNATASATSPLASVEKPNSLGSWPTRMTTARPAR